MVVGYSIGEKFFCASKSFVFLAGFVEGGNALASVGASGSPVLPVLKVSLRAEHFFEGDFAGGGVICIFHVWSIGKKLLCGKHFLQKSFFFFCCNSLSINELRRAPEPPRNSFSINYLSANIAGVQAMSIAMRKGIIDGVLQPSIPRKTSRGMYKIVEMKVFILFPPKRGC